MKYTNLTKQEHKEKADFISLKKTKADFLRAHITCPDDLNEYARNFYFDDISIYESFFIVPVDNSNNTLGYAKISQGGITGTLVDVRIVTKIALDSLAVGLFLVHNHPSGKLKPSEADKKITDKIKEGLQFFDIKLLDHLILTDDNFYSFADNLLI